jgi:hypothetical protein
LLLSWASSAWANQADLDGPFPRHLIDTEGAHGVASRFKVDIVDREKPTIGQLVQRLAGACGHWVIAVPPEKIADNPDLV